MQTKSNIVYLNGEFLPLEEARIPVMDRGFLFGDSIYEVIPAYSGRLFRLPHHLQRLTDSLNAIRMQNPLSAEQWHSMLESLVKQNPGQDQSVYLQVSRGAAVARDHAIPEGISPTVFAMSTPFSPIDPKMIDAGIQAITLDDIRWRLCNIKATTLLANVLLRQQAKDKLAIEAILIRDGQATEGAASNLFIVTNGKIITPPKSHYLLPGITRDLVLELALKHDLSFQERSITEIELKGADEVWLTSSTKEIMPVTLLNGQPVGNGEPGPIFREMSGLYTEYKQRIKAGLEV